jgi:hypothetical protein
VKTLPQRAILTSKRTGEVNELDEREYFTCIFSITQMHPGSGKRNMVETRITRKRNLSIVLPLTVERSTDMTAQLRNIEMRQAEGRRGAMLSLMLIMKQTRVLHRKILLREFLHKDARRTYHCTRHGKPSENSKRRRVPALCLAKERRSSFRSGVLVLSSFVGSAMPSVETIAPESRKFQIVWFWCMTFTMGNVSKFGVCRVI